MSSKNIKNSKNGKYNTYYSYSLVGNNGVIQTDLSNRVTARHNKRVLVKTLNLKNKDISIIQTAVSNVR